MNLRRTLAPSVAFSLIFWGPGGLGYSGPAAATAAPVPVVVDCANPRLPAAILAGTAASGSIAAGAEPLPVVDAAVADTTLQLAVASDEKNRELGLMCVTALRPHHGMIFVFKTSRQWDFWMKNTLVPLDMVWLDEAGTITTIASAVPASKRTTPDRAVARRSGAGLYVVELRSGEAQHDGLRVGERMTLPSLRASE